MVKKKVTKKKTTTKKVVRKKTPIKKNIQTKKNILKVGKFKTNKLFFTSLIVFIISFALYLIIQKPEVLYAVFGFIAIIAGSLVLLSIILELIFWLLRRAGKK